MFKIEKYITGAFGQYYKVILKDSKEILFVENSDCYHVVKESAKKALAKKGIEI